MAQNKILRFGPTTLTITGGNVVNPPLLTGGTGLSGTNASTYCVLKKMTLTNRTASAVTAGLFVGATGATAAGTDIWVNATSIPANQSIQWTGLLRLDSLDYLVGVGTATSVTFEGEGEIGIAG